MTRHLPAAFAALLFLAPAAFAQQSVPAGDPEILESVDPQQRRITEEIVRDYILRHPEIVLEAIRILQAREEAAAGERALQAMAANADDLRDDPHSPVGGNPEGDVTVVEFFDYACPYCHKAHPVIADLTAKDRGVRVVYKEFPILGEASVYAARIGIAVHLLAPDKYLAYHKAMFETGGRLATETALRTALGLGLERTRLLEAMESDTVATIINGNIRLAQAIGINGTPAFVVGDAIVPGLVAVEQFQELVAQAREACTTC